MRDYMRDLIDFTKEIMLPVSVFLILPLILLCLSMVGIGYIQSCYQSNVFNRLNNTEFTCTDFFFAAEQINSNTQTIKLK